MAYFLATNVLSDTPPVKTPCITSNMAQKITLPIDASQPYIINGKFLLMSDSKMTKNDMVWGTMGTEWSMTCSDWSGQGLAHREAYNYGSIQFDTWFRFTDAKHITEVPDVWNRTATNFNPGTSGYPFTLFGCYDNDNVWHYGAIALSAFDVTLNDVKVMDMVPVNAYNEDRGAKEGGFYDIVNDKYYFSETSTPLVYSEL